MFFLNHPATLSAMDLLRISITVWPECDVLAPAITRILPLMRSMMRQRCKRTSMSTRDMRLLGSSEITNDSSQAKNWKIAKRQFSDFFPFRLRLYHRVRWSSQVFEPMLLFWLMYAWQLGDDKWHGKDFGGCLEVFLPVLRLRVACLHFHQEGAACGSGSDRDMSQVLSYFLGKAFSCLQYQIEELPVLAI